MTHSIEHDDLAYTVAFDNLENRFSTTYSSDNPAAPGNILDLRDFQLLSEPIHSTKAEVPGILPLIKRTEYDLSSRNIRELSTCRPDEAYISPERLISDHTLTLSFSHILILSYSHSLILSYSYTLILSYSYTLILSLSHLLTTPYSSAAPHYSTSDKQPTALCDV